MTVWRLTWWIGSINIANTVLSGSTIYWHSGKEEIPYVLLSKAWVITKNIWIKISIIILIIIINLVTGCGRRVEYLIISRYMSWLYVNAWVCERSSHSFYQTIFLDLLFSFPFFIKTYLLGWLCNDFGLLIAGPYNFNFLFLTVDMRAYTGYVSSFMAPYTVICDAIYVADAVDGAVTSHFQCLESSL